MPAHDEAIDDAWSVAEGAPYLVDVTYLPPEQGIKLIILPGNPAQNTSPNMPRWAAIFAAPSSTKLAGSAHQFLLRFTHNGCSLFKSSGRRCLNIEPE